MAEIPTIKIKSSHPPSQGEYVLINEVDFDPTVHERYTDGPPVTVPPPIVSPPPPPSVADPLADLPADWENLHGTRLKNLAAVVAGGRTVENVEQAKQIIREELERRKAV